MVPSFEGKGPLLRHLLGTEAAYVERLRGFKVRGRCLYMRTQRRTAWPFSYPKPAPSHNARMLSKAAFIDPVEKRDTEDRRKLRALPKVRVNLDRVLCIFVYTWYNS